MLADLKNRENGMMGDYHGSDGSYINRLCSELNKIEII